MRADSEAAPDDVPPTAIGMLMPAGVARDLVRARLADEPGIVLYDLLADPGADVPPITAMDVVLVAGPGVRVPPGRVAPPVPPTRFAALDLGGVDARLLVMTTGEVTVGVTPDTLVAAVRALARAGRGDTIRSPD